MRMTSEDKSSVNSYTNNGAFDPRSRTQTSILIYETCFQNNLRLSYCDFKENILHVINIKIHRSGWSLHLSHQKLQILEQWLPETHLLKGPFGFQKELIIEKSLPMPLYTQHHLWMETGLWCGWWWFILLIPWSIPFHISVQHSFFIVHYDLF